MTFHWEKLFRMACSLIDQVNGEHKLIDRWTFGGGTAMMLQINHRDSHDVDIFLDDPQLLPFLDPAKRDFEFQIAPSAYQSDGTGSLKIAFDGIGEIDFIASANLTDQPTTMREVLGREVLVETIPEIITKKRKRFYERSPAGHDFGTTSRQEIHRRKTLEYTNRIVRTQNGYCTG